MALLYLLGLNVAKTPVCSSRNFTIYSAVSLECNTMSQAKDQLLKIFNLNKGKLFSQSFQIS